MTRMLNLREVRDILGLSANGVISLVKYGHLPAYKYVGGRVDREALGFDERGLRFKETDIEAMLNESKV